MKGSEKGQGRRAPSKKTETKRDESKSAAPADKSSPEKMRQSSTLLDMFLQTLEPHPKYFEANSEVKEEVDQNNNSGGKSAPAAAEVVQAR